MTAVSILSSNVGILQNEKRLIELLSPSGAAYKGFYLVQSFFLIFLWVMLASLLSCYLSPRPNLQTTMSVNNVRLRSRLQSLMTLTIWSKNLPPNKKEKGHGRHHVPFTGFLSCMFVSHLLLKYLRCWNYKLNITLRITVLSNLTMSRWQTSWQKAPL